MNKKNIKIIIFLILVAFLGIFIIFSISREGENKNYKEISVNNNKIYVEIADTTEKRKKGLSEREDINENHGMLFIFDKKDYWGIWMKDMLMEIDIIWLDENGVVVDLKEKISPDTYPEVFLPKQMATFVLEFKAGFIENNKISIGNKFSLTF